MTPPDPDSAGRRPAGQSDAFGDWFITTSVPPRRGPPRLPNGPRRDRFGWLLSPWLLAPTATVAVATTGVALWLWQTAPTGTVQARPGAAVIITVPAATGGLPGGPGRPLRVIPPLPPGITPAQATASQSQAAGTGDEAGGTPAPAGTTPAEPGPVTPGGPADAPRPSPSPTPPAAVPPATTAPEPGESATNVPPPAQHSTPPPEPVTSTPPAPVTSTPPAPVTTAPPAPVDHPATAVCDHPTAVCDHPATAAREPARHLAAALRSQSMDRFLVTRFSCGHAEDASPGCTGGRPSGGRSWPQGRPPLAARGTDQGGVHCDSRHGWPVPRTETGRVRISPARGPLASRWRVSVMPSAFRYSAVMMNRVRVVARPSGCFSRSGRWCRIREGGGKEGEVAGAGRAATSRVAGQQAEGVAP